MVDLVTGLGGAAGYGENSFATVFPSLHGNNRGGNLDDGWVKVNVSSIFPSGMNLYGTNYSNMYISTNGIISFGSGITTYTPTALNTLGQTTIAPFWTDIDINKGGAIYWDLDPANGNVTVTWAGVHPYTGSGTNSFQVVLSNAGGGNVGIDLRYSAIGFTNGYTGNATVGISNGSTQQTLLPGSGNSTALANYAGTDFQTNDPVGQYTLGFTGGAIDLRDGSVDGTSGNDLINGSYIDSENDRIDANDALGYSGTTGNDDFVRAGAGNDTVYSIFGNDQIYGDAGNDLIYAGDGNDLAFGGADSDTVYGDAGNDSLTGDAGNDSLFGGDGRDSLYGGAENDTLAGDAGNDLVYGGDGDDVAAGGAGNDTVYGDAGNDSLTGDAGTDSLFGGDGRDSLYGGAENDTLAGDAGNDLLYGGDGNDVVAGGAEVDTIYGDAGNDVLAGGDGNDLLFGGLGNDTIYGGAGDEGFAVEAGSDALFGGTGNDSFQGALGDTVDGGVGGLDTLDLTAWGWSLTNIIYDPLNRENGVVQFLDASGAVIGSMAFLNIDRVVTCFTPGTMIETDRGRVAVECLAQGDLVLTRDHGLQPLRWIGRRDLGLAELIAAPRLNPVLIAAGALGPGLPRCDMLVSPQHRMLFSGARAEMLFGEEEVLVAAVHLTGLAGVAQVQKARVSYIHLMFDSHELIEADGAWSESFQPADRSLRDMDAAQRAEIALLFPDLAEGLARFPAARLSLKAHEARVFLAA